MDLIALRFALYAALFAQFGIAAFGLYALPADQRGLGRPFRYARVLPPLCLASLAFAMLGIVAHLASMAGTGWWPVDGEMLRAMLGETDLGAAWIARIAVLLAALAGSIVLRRRTTWLLGLHVLASGIAIATLVWSGHAGATEGSAGTVHRIGDILHMLAAAVWFGGLLSFGGLLFGQTIVANPAQIALAKRTLDHFGRVGTLAVVVIVGTGLLNSAMIFGIDRLTDLAMLYAALLGIKLLLFAVMLGCAALNRWRLTPKLKADEATPGKAVAAMRRSLMIETLAAMVILGSVAWLGTLAPMLAPS